MKKIIYRLREFFNNVEYKHLKNKACLSSIERVVLRTILYFYDERDPDVSDIEISQLGITNIKVTKRAIYITLERPGVLIGEKGSNLEAFQNYLKECQDIDLPVRIIESSIYSYIF